MGILNRIIDFDPIIKSAVDHAMDRVPAIIDAVEKRVQALLPLLVAAGMKAIMDRIDDSPVGDVLDIAENARAQLNQIPDIDIPGLSEHFDLTEFLKGFGK